MAEGVECAEGADHEKMRDANMRGRQGQAGIHDGSKRFFHFTCTQHSRPAPPSECVFVLISTRSVLTSRDGNRNRQ